VQQEADKKEEAQPKPVVSDSVLIIPEEVKDQIAHNSHGSAPTSKEPE
jgi:hypothetical protein